MVAGSAIASAVVIFGAYTLRMISRLTITRYCWWDDFFHTLSVVCAPTAALALTSA